MKIALPLLLALALSACGGGGGSSTNVGSGSYDLGTALAARTTNGYSATLDASGSVTVSGTAYAVTGTAALAALPAVSSGTHGVPALGQTLTVTGTISANGQSRPYSASVVDVYDGATYAWLAESSAGEYDVAQTPAAYPATVMLGDTGVVETFSRYTDANLGVSLGTTENSYLVKANPADGATVIVEFISKIHDTQGALLETDTTDFSLTKPGVMTLLSATAVTPANTLTFTAH